MNAAIYKLINDKISNNGVGYYNIEEQTNNIEKHITMMAPHLSLGKASPLETSSQVTTAVECLDSRSQLEEEEPLDSESGFERAAEESPLSFKMVKRAVIQFFDNGEDSKQRRKLKIRFNFVDDTNWEFIAALTADRRNFLKHTVDRDVAAEWWDTHKDMAKRKYNTTPWGGKFHLNHGRTAGKQAVQVEPNCFASVWYQPEDRGYACSLAVYDFVLTELDLFKESLTDLQRNSGVKAQFLWINPEYNTVKRNPTFAEMRQKNAKKDSL